MVVVQIFLERALELAKISIVAINESSDMHINSSKTLGQLVRRCRESLKLSIPDCAAWCNVGPRFLFDLENAKASVQMDKVLDVTSRLGIKLFAGGAQESWRELNLVTDAPVDVSPVVLSAPGFDGADWLASRAIGYMAATRCAIPVLKQVFDRDNDRLQITPEARAVPLLAHTGRSSLREEQGGPGYREIFAAIDERSVAPIRDVALALRWAVFSYLVADVTTSAADLRLSASEGVLAPFGVIACASGEVAADRVYRGMRIGRDWPDDWLRVDHWVDFAAMAGVKPSIVLEIMADLAERVALAVREAAVSYSRSTILRGAPSTIANIAHARGTRMKDLMLSAGHQGVRRLKPRRAAPAT